MNVRCKYFSTDFRLLQLSSYFLNSYNLHASYSTTNYPDISDWLKFFILRNCQLLEQQKRMGRSGWEVGGEREYEYLLFMVRTLTNRDAVNLPSHCHLFSSLSCQGNSNCRLKRRILLKYDMQCRLQIFFIREKSSILGSHLTQSRVRRKMLEVFERSFFEGDLPWNIREILILFVLTPMVIYFS